LSIGVKVGEIDVNAVVDVVDVAVVATVDVALVATVDVGFDVKFDCIFVLSFFSSSFDDVKELIND